MNPDNRAITDNLINKFKEHIQVFLPHFDTVKIDTTYGNVLNFIETHKNTPEVQCIKELISTGCQTAIKNEINWSLFNKPYTPENNWSSWIIEKLTNYI